MLRSPAKCSLLQASSLPGREPESWRAPEEKSNGSIPLHEPNPTRHHSLKLPRRSTLHAAKMPGKDNSLRHQLHNSQVPCSGFNFSCSSREVSALLVTSHWRTCLRSGGDMLAAPILMPAFVHGAPIARPLRTFVGVRWRLQVPCVASHRSPCEHISSSSLESPVFQRNRSDSRQVQEQPENNYSEGTFLIDCRGG